MNARPNEIPADQQLSVEEVRAEVREAWRLAGLRSTTVDHFDRMIRGLALVLFRSPKETQSLVEAAIGNAERRRDLVERMPR